MADSAAIAGLVLSAGQSLRAGAENKLLRDMGGRPMVARVAETAVRAGLAPVIAVTGHDRAAVEAALTGTGAETAHNPDFADGMGSSIARGIAALSADAGAAVVLLGDMPGVGAHTLKALMAAHDPAAGRDICIPVMDGRRGNPVLFGRRFFEALKALTGDVGGKGVIADNADAVFEVAVTDPGVLVDYDT